MPPLFKAQALSCCDVQQPCFLACWTKYSSRDRPELFAAAAWFQTHPCPMADWESSSAAVSGRCSFFVCNNLKQDSWFDSFYRQKVLQREHIRFSCLQSTSHDYAGGSTGVKKSLAFGLHGIIVFDFFVFVSTIIYIYILYISIASYCMQKW